MTMRVVVVYKEQTDYARTVTDYLRDFERQTGHTLELLNPDTPEGAHFCRTYDVVEYPSVVAMTDDGIMQNMWRGLPLPTI
ncbi:MAG TPA: hypothetical protein VFS65_01090, partial [Candidatus Saccharimonadales bacterium]|nr:hypothetical protein [Candidatus Saccharimonadales bacterium]